MKNHKLQYHTKCETNVAYEIVCSC